MRLFGKLEKRSILPADKIVGGFFTSIFGDSGVNSKEALGLPAVYTCVSLISDTIASLPVDVYRKTRNGPSVPVTTPTWLKQPSPRMTRVEFINTVLNSLLLEGNAYIIALRNDRGEVLELDCLAPSRISIEQLKNGDLVYFVDKKILPSNITLLHIKGMTLPGEFQGVSPISAVRRTINMGLNAEQFGADFYRNGLNVTHAIEMPQQASKMTQEDIKRMREQFTSTHSGTNSSGLAILTNGAQFKQLSLSPKDAEYIESRKFTAIQIANIYRVPPYIVDPSVTSTWGTGIAEQNRNFVEKTLLPWIKRIEESISLWLLPGNQILRFNVDGLLRGDLSTRYEAYNKGIQGGFITPNEAREKEDLLPYTGGDSMILPLNMSDKDLMRRKQELEIQKLQAEIEAIKGGTNPPQEDI